MSLLNVLHIGASATVAQSQRLNAIASNIANAESTTSANGEAYRALQVVFRPKPDLGGVGAGVEVASVVPSTAPLRRMYQPGHPNADTDGYVQGSNVDPVDEMVNMVAASRSYQMNIELMNNSRQLLQRVIDMVRT
jgi:flagellar basal-body rod protein FlgC